MLNESNISKPSKKIRKSAITPSPSLGQSRPHRKCATKTKAFEYVDKRSRRGRPKVHKGVSPIDAPDPDYELAETTFVYFLGHHLDAIRGIAAKPEDKDILSRLESKICTDHQNYESFRKDLFKVIENDKNGDLPLCEMKVVAKKLKHSLTSNENTRDHEEEKEIMFGEIATEKFEANQFTKSIDTERQVKFGEDRIFLTYLFWYLARNLIKMELVEDFFRILLFVGEVQEENNLILQDLDKEQWKKVIIDKCLEGELRFLHNYKEKHQKQLLKDLVDLMLNFLRKAQVYCG